MALVSSSRHFIDIEGICNARQLEGYMGADGRKIRDGLLFRTAGLDKISDETAKLLSEIYHIRYVVDLRMEYERELACDKEIPGAENIWISVFEMDISAPENIEIMEKIKQAGGELQKTVEYAKTGRLSRLYTDILLGNKGQKGYARFLIFCLIIRTVQSCGIVHTERTEQVLPQRWYSLLLVWTRISLCRISF